MAIRLSSLRTRFFIAVLACAVVPMAAVGGWLTMSISNAGERFIEAQLDSIASRAVITTSTRWEFRQADLVLLADNEPVRHALFGDPEPGPDSIATTRYLEQVFQSMPGFSSVTIRDARQRVRWTFGVPPDEPRGLSSIEPRRHMAMRRVITGERGDTIGSVETRVRLESLLASPSAPTDAGSGFVALHSLENDAWLLPTGVQPSSLAASRFEWRQHRWAVVKRVIADPPLEIFAAAPADGFIGALSRTASVGTLALAVVGLVVLLLSMVVTRRLTSSLSRLASAADSVSRGDLDTLIDVTTHDEVGRVARTFNEMTASVRAMMRERSQREAVSAMGELAATLAHQVRSPATAMRLDIERARMKLGADAPERELLDRALKQLDRLERVVSGSLRVARSGAVRLKSLDVRKPLERAIAGVSTEAAERGVTVAVDDNGESLTVMGDAPSLEQLFTNVLTNAVQASRNGGTVTVRVSSKDSSVAVTDDGDLVSPEILERAGEPFFSTKPEGTGLGLAIARRIAAAHGAELELRSCGTGATAEVRFGSETWREHPPVTNGAPNATARNIAPSHSNLS